MEQSIPVLRAYEPLVAADISRSTSVDVMVTGDAAVAAVAYRVPGPTDADGYAPKVFRGSGASKRERGDKHDPVTGELLAVARAFDEAAARLFREARSRIRAQDNEQQQKATRRTKEEWEAIQEGREAHARVEDLAAGSGECLAVFPKGEEIDVTSAVKEALTDLSAGLNDVISVLRD